MSMTVMRDFGFVRFFFFFFFADNVRIGDSEFVFVFRHISKMVR